MADQSISRFAQVKALPLSSDTHVHVAQFLQEPIGATRQVRLALEAMPLDEEMRARAIVSDVKLTRIPTGILAHGDVTATVAITCIRCLEEYDYVVRTTFTDEFRPTVDVLSGAEVSPAVDSEPEAEYFTISDAHLLDLREALRQAIVLGLPMAPLCREDCPGLLEAEVGAGAATDSRLAVLSQLLDGGDAGEEPPANNQ